MKRTTNSSQAARPFVVVVGWAMMSGLLFVGAGRLLAQEPPEPVPGALNTVPIPEPPNLLDFVKDKDAAKRLGKAFFWDMQAGGDGVQACASCHFFAGADPRLKNQISPGLLDGDTTFQVGGPNYELQASDFPFHRLQDPLDRNSTVLFTTNDVTSSQGVCRTDFVDVNNTPVDTCNHVDDPVFQVAGTNTRRVEPRNAPSVINAIFNHRNFHDGRANFIFNGVNPFGRRDPNARIWEIQPDTTVMPVIAHLEFASTASQAVGPPLSFFEMSCDGRTFPLLGRKMIPFTPLAMQVVAADDSVLGGLSNFPNPGLNTTYEDMIKAAFWEKYWDSTTLVNGGFTVMEANFSLFWGLSIQIYESMLVSDDAPFDRFRDENNPDPNALSAAAQRGLDLFMTTGRCINCHRGPEFATGISHLVGEMQEDGLVERMIMGDGGVSLYDNGFYNIGVTETNDDLGVGGTDPFGNPLSFTRQYIQILRGQNVPDPFQVDPCKFEIRFPLLWLDGSRPFDCNGDGRGDTAEPTGQNDIDGLRVAVDGAIKVPILRNVELTGPYMHNGSMQTLEQVMEFYVRGGNFQNRPDQDPDIQVLPFDAQDMADVVEFLKSLTDERVRNQEAPFDHPQLFVPNGHVGGPECVYGVDCATSCMVEIPAVGAGGGALTLPLPVCDTPVGEVVLLTPCEDFNPQGSDHTVTATVLDGIGQPVAGVTVTFNVVSGPNAGANGTAMTDANGVATFTYTDTGGTGQDTIVASYENAMMQTIVSNNAVKLWDPPTINCPPDVVVECCRPTDPSATGEASGVGACSEGVTVTYSDQVTPGPCEQGSKIERTWTVTDECGYTNSCVQTIYITVSQKVGYHNKGDVFVFPYVKIAWNSANGAVLRDTFISLTNDDTRPHKIKLLYVDGQLRAGTDPNCPGGCRNLDRTLNLTGNESAYFSAFTGSGGLSTVGSFRDLNPAGMADDEPSGRLTVQGFILAWTVDENNVPVGTNHIAASATIVDYGEESSWEYKPWAFRSNFVGTFDESSHPNDQHGGILRLDGSNDGYQKAPSHLLLDFYSTGDFGTLPSAFGAAKPADFVLTLLPLAIDLRAIPDLDLDGKPGEIPVPGGRAQDCSPPVTAVQVLSWNELESQISNTIRCVECWDSTLGSEYRTIVSAGPPMVFTTSPFSKAALQTNKGKARLRGSRDLRCDQAAGSVWANPPIYQKLSIDLPILGVSHKIITFTASGVKSRANSALTALGERTDAFIRFDTTDQGTPPTLSGSPDIGAAGIGSEEETAPVRVRGTR